MALVGRFMQDLTFHWRGRQRWGGTNNFNWVEMVAVAVWFMEIRQQTHDLYKPPSLEHGESTAAGKLQARPTRKMIILANFRE